MRMKKLLVLGDLSEYRFHNLAELEPLVKVLEKEYEVCLSEAYPDLTAEALAGISGVINYIDNWQERGNTASEHVLEEYIKNGGRMLVLHCGIILKSAASLRDAFGGSFTGHAQYQPLLFKASEARHEVIEGMHSFTAMEEPYRFDLTEEGHTEVLLTYELEGQEYPAGWVRRHGSGSILYLLPGHNRKTFENEEVLRLCRRAVDWMAAGRTGL